ncbi:MAG: DUF4430 domain-containing protein [Clostridia bacterium]|nr:DUF4430 domain-containing protein [Clostridia bacterium]
MRTILKHKNKIIAGACIAAVLAFAFWWGGDSPLQQSREPNEFQFAERTQTPEAVPTDVPKQGEESTTEPNPPPADPTSMPFDAKNETMKEMTGISQSARSEKEEYAEEQGIAWNQSTDKDTYTTSPMPAKPQETQKTDKAFTCILSVRCDTILKNIQRLDEQKISIVPKNGIIFAEQEVPFYAGESVFNVTLREMKRNKIHFEFVNTPIYKSAYIEGIANLYEFDCGELSGWMYKVNGLFPNYGCSRYMLQQGDRVEWVYTCDLGKDVGGGIQQRDA